MSNYFTLKNRTILNPPTGTDLGSGNNKFANVYIGNQLTVGTTTVDSSSIGSIKIASITYPGDDTAADTAGGQTITITGSGFVAGASVIIDGATVSVVSVVSSTQITFTAPAKTTGSYSLYVINPDGATAISVVGIQFSGVPAWITAAGSLSTMYESDIVNTQLSATGDAPVIYSLASGSLPGGLTLYGNGRVLGTANTLASSTTYNFTVKASDYQNQDTDRAFSYTVNPESVTFNTPASNQTYSNSISDAFSLTVNATSSAGKTITYTANALPSGLTLSGAVISGTLSGAGSTTSLITAAAVGSVKTATRTLSWTVTSPQLTVDFMVVGGGGGGSDPSGGGGGAGGYRTSVGTSGSTDTFNGGGSSAETALTLNRGTAYTVTVGAGGTRFNDSTSDSVFATITSLGGGGGDWAAGGSGGGTSGYSNGNYGSGTRSQGNQGASGQGTRGGGGMYGANNPIVPGGGGGGGGAFQSGANGYYWTAGGGGQGIESSITGTATYYAGGGGGGASAYGSGGGGGAGGGGNGAVNSPGANGTAGTANTGGGGGGGRGRDTSYAGGGNGANGGSGIVVLRTADSVAAAASTTGSPTITVAGGYRVYKWTSSGSVTF
jgi:hypothetical protein